MIIVWQQASFESNTISAINLPFGRRQRTGDSNHLVIHVDPQLSLFVQGIDTDDEEPSVDWKAIF